MSTAKEEPGGAVVRRSIRERIAEQKTETNPLVEASLSTLADINETTSTFRVDATGELVVDAPAPLPVTVEPTAPMGELDALTASAYHLLMLPSESHPDDLEALAISVWNEAGWLSPGILRLQEGATLEGPWAITTETAQDLGIEDAASAQIWLVRCPARRGPAPSEELAAFNELARAFPQGMPVGLEDKVLEFLRRVARRLDGVIRIAGSGAILSPEPESAVNLRVFSSTWLPPAETEALLEPYIPGLHAPSPISPMEGAPYAFLAPVGSRSQVLIGVREETVIPRALRWEIWAKGQLCVYEIVWAAPEDLHDLARRPTRSGRLERARASRIIEAAAAVLVQQLDDPIRGGAAVIDEDGFLVGLDGPLPEEEEQRL